MATESRMGREIDISEKVPAILINTRKRMQNVMCRIYNRGESK